MFWPGNRVYKNSILAHSILLPTTFFSRLSVPYFSLMFFRRFANVLLIMPLLAACSSSVPELPGFDAAVWRGDTYGCQDRRPTQLKSLLQAKEQLYGLRTATVEKLLGRPDEEELAEQTEKIYNYYLESGPHCLPTHQRSGANKLSIRFGPLGTVTEVLTARPNSF
jgi:hypothetical protein